MILVPWISLGDDRPQVGFGEAFEIEVRPGCQEATGGTIAWRQVEGPGLTLVPGWRGFRVRGRMPGVRRVWPGGLPWGVAPISAAEQQRVVLEAAWSGGGRRVRRTIRLAAAARASGVPALAVGQRIYLGGEGWRVVEPQPRSAAIVEIVGGVASFLPDRLGRWLLQDDDGRILRLSARRHDRTRLDCGRGECHPRVASAVLGSRMTHVLRAGLEGRLGAAREPACALACHATGEPGLADGGFVHVARELGVQPRAFAELAVPDGAAPWGTLPRDLRRLGGVGCTACHGPGTIPDVPQRWTILRVGVCAVCHDAPPDYVTVAEWRASRKAGADGHPGARGAACRRCHTPDGFLSALGAWTGAPMPDDALPIGLGCVTCHAPHAEARGAALVRRVATPPIIGDAAPDERSRICVPCHAPDPSPAPPRASAAAIWAGRGGVSVATGAPMVGPRGPGEGCLSCHGVTVAEGRRGRRTPHTFASTEPDPAPARAAALAERAGRLRARLVERLPALDLSHAARSRPRARTDALGRAAYDLQLVLQDRAAAAHNLPYAIQLLDEAESALPFSAGPSPRIP